MALIWTEKSYMEVQENCLVTVNDYDEFQVQNYIWTWVKQRAYSETSEKFHWVWSINPTLMNNTTRISKHTSCFLVPKSTRLVIFFNFFFVAWNKDQKDVFLYLKEQLLSTTITSSLCIILIQKEDFINCWQNESHMSGYLIRKSFITCSHDTLNNESYLTFTVFQNLEHFST